LRSVTHAFEFVWSTSTTVHCHPMGSRGTKALQFRVGYLFGIDSVCPSTFPSTLVRHVLLRTCLPLLHTYWDRCSLPNAFTIGINQQTIILTSQLSKRILMCQQLATNKHLKNAMVTPFSFPQRLQNGVASRSETAKVG
jgi:hypothetical protein